jgi:probable F420-dependent oxidoreductase
MRFGLQLRADDPSTVGADARRAEELGFDTVLVADHVGSDWSPLQCLAAAAAATERIRIGTFVLNAGLHHPLTVAREIATLDRLSGGRVELGLGAGHTSSEFAAMGATFLPAAERKVRLAEFVEIVRALLDGDTVDHHTDHFQLTAAATGPARPAGRVPILVGGSGTALLSHAAHHADIVGFTGLGRTLPDGHRHTVRFQPEVLDAEVAVVREAAGERSVELNVLVQVVDITDNRRSAAERLASSIDGLTVDDALVTPFLALGTPAEIASHLRAAESRWGIGYAVVRDAEAFAPVLDALHGRTAPKRETSPDP